ncbi:MAG: hypothetical protein JSW63_09690 [Ignavibacterium sp.]|nr:MAG: hypothetical protein JSW63_09690 [Ignavibacterium sp.]
MIKTPKTLLTILLILISGLNVYAQKYGINNKTLSNGLDVIVINNPAVPLVTIELDVKN